MTTQDTQLIHFYGALTVLLPGPGFSGGRVMKYGEELLVTPEIRELSKDRYGSSWLDLLDQDEAQIKRWGKVMFKSGPWPEHLLRVEIGSQEWLDERETQRATAYQITDEEARNDRLRRIDQAYGRPTTSRTLLTTREQTEERPW